MIDSSLHFYCSSFTKAIPNILSISSIECIYNTFTFSVFSRVQQQPQQQNPIGWFAFVLNVIIKKNFVTAVNDC